MINEELLVLIPSFHRPSHLLPILFGMWDVAVAHVNVVVAFLQMSASRFIKTVCFGETQRIKDR